MLLQSHEKFDNVAVFDEISGEISFCSRAEAPQLTGSKIEGIYYNAEKGQCLFYRSGDHLILRVNENKVTISDRVDSNFKKKEDGLCVFEVFENHKLVLKFSYQAPEPLVPVDIDLTPFVEYEDFDFFYLVHNVIRDRNRMARIFR